jgi:hypothetical protein
MRVATNIRKVRWLLVAALVGALGVAAHAQRIEQGQRIENSIANFSALDKVTAAVRQLPIELNKTGEFRTLKITPRVCYTRDPKEAPRTSTFVEVDEILFEAKRSESSPDGCLPRALASTRSCIRCSTCG